MKGSKCIALLLVLALSASLVLTGCGSKKPDVSGPQKVTINLGNEPVQMNSILATDTVSMSVHRHVTEGLITLDKENRPVPGIAEKWDISKDGLVYTFHLRDAKWSDGSAVLAKDFVFSLQQLLTKDVASEYAYIAYMIKNAENFYNGKAKFDEVGIKAKDDKTIEITLERPTAYFLGLLSFISFMPVKEDYYKSQGKKYGTEANSLLYNGPWTIKSWTHEDKIILQKNPNYWNADEIYLDEITMLMVKDSNTALNQFLANEADMVGLSGSQLEKVKADGYTPSQYSDGATCYFQFNFKDSIMKNINIRKALTYAMDRATYIKNVRKDNCLPALSYTNPDIIGNKSFFQKEVGNLFKDNDVENAKKLLATGLKELNLTTLPKFKLLTDDTDVAKRDAAYYQEAWKKNLGIECEVASVPFKSRIQAMQSHDFQVVVALWGPDYNDPMTFVDMWVTDGGNNHGLYSNSEYDDYIKKATAEVDSKKRFDLLEKAEKKIVEDMIIGPIYFRNRDYVVKPYLKDVVRTAFQDINMRWAYIDNKEKK